MVSVFVFSGLLALLLTCQATRFPSHWKACKMGPNHNECMKEAVQKVLPELAKGLPGLGIIPIDPLVFTRVSIDQGDSPVSVDLDFQDMNITGLKDVKVESIQNDWKTMIIDATAPMLQVNSKYKVKGKVLVLPVHGKGDCFFELDNYKTKLTLRFDEKTMGKKVYYHIKDVEITMDTDPMKMKFNNLFDGNKELGDHFNEFVNENWKDIFTELKPAIEQALQRASSDLATRFFARVPKNEITPQ